MAGSTRVGWLLQAGRTAIAASPTHLATLSCVVVLISPNGGGLLVSGGWERSNSGSGGGGGGGGGSLAGLLSQRFDLQHRGVRRAYGLTSS